MSMLSIRIPMASTPKYLFQEMKNAVEFFLRFIFVTFKEGRIAAEGGCNPAKLLEAAYWKIVVNGVGR